MANKLGANRQAPNGGRGRPKGAVNKSTKAAREAIAAFVDANAEKLQGWLDEIAADSPKDAFNAFLALVEYHVPKLGRVEHSGPDGTSLFPQSVEFIVRSTNTAGPS